MNAISSAPAVQAPVQTASAPASGGESTTGASFAQVLNALSSGGNTTGGDLAGLNQTLSWRDMQTMLGLTIGGTSGPDLIETLSGDLVLEDLMRMLKELVGEDPKNLSLDGIAQAQDLAVTIQKKLQDILDQNGQAVALQELYALMMPGWQIPTTVAETEETLSAIPYQGVLLDSVLTSEPAEMIQMLTGLPKELFQLPTEGHAVPLTEAQTQAAPQLQTVQTVETQPQSGGQTGQPQADVNATPNSDNIQTLMLNSPAADDPESLFLSSVREAKQQLAKTETAPAGPKKELDADALQKQVDSGMYLKNTSFGANMEAKQAELPAPVAAQLETGIAAGLEKGMQEFTIKLMPEGLGEVTVKLVKTAEGMTLNLVAKNAETQRILAAELDTLRDTMKPLRVEVESVLTERQESLLSQQQSSQQQTQQDWRTFKGAAYYGDEPLSARESDAMEEAMAAPIGQAAPPSALNAYI